MAVMSHERFSLKRHFLQEMDIFCDLPHEDMIWLERSTKMLQVPRGKVIYQQGDTAVELFLIKRGSVRLLRFTQDGKRLELATLGPGVFFGEMPLLGERKRDTSAEAIEDSLLCVMTALDLEHLILRRPEVGLRMLHILGRRLRECEDRLEQHTYRSAPARLASLLLRVAEGNAIEGLSHQEMADAIGVYRETVTKILDYWAGQGYVELRRRRLCILQPASLARIAREGRSSY